MRWRWRHSAAIFLACVGVAAAARGDSSSNELANPGFETAAAKGQAAGWKAYGSGYTLDVNVVHSAARSIRCEATASAPSGGLGQVIRYDKPDRRPIIIGGWSKAENVGGGGDYSLYLDVIYEDGAPCWGKTSPWSRGTHDWEYAAAVYYPEKPVREIRAYVFLRRTTGKAWFDDVFLYRGGLHVTQVRVASDFPRTRDGQRVRAELTLDAGWQCALLDKAGKELATSAGRGKKISWDWPGMRDAHPARLRLTAQSANGEQLVHESPAAQSPPAAKNPVRDGYALWWRNSMQKIAPTEFPPDDRSKPAAIALARNEREGFQVAITPADGVELRNVRVSVKGLVNQQGQAFPPVAIQQHLVGYLYVDTPSGHPDAPSSPHWCPEVLLPGRPFHALGGRTQSVWITVHAAPETQPGVYRGKVVVTPENASPAELPLTVRVWRFALPQTPRMRTAFAMMDGFTQATYGPITPELRRRCLDLMLGYRLNPDDISRTEPPAVDDLLYARQHGLNAFNILNLVPRPKGHPLWVCYAPLADYRDDFTNELASRLDDYVAQLRKHDLAKTAYFYGFDERGPEYDELIKRICKSLKERYPEISTFTTAGYMYEKRRDTPAGYQDYMDWYCPLTPKYDRELSRRLRAEGKQVWWYVCCGPKYPYANFASIDYPSIEGRLLGWMTYGWEADGLLYWHVNDWRPRKVIETDTPYLDWKPACLWGMTGDGCLTYPTRDGPVGSIRLENLRDGSEDYDYLALLADAKGRAVAERFVARLVTSLTEFSRDPAALAAARAAIAEELEAVSK